MKTDGIRNLMDEFQLVYKHMDRLAEFLMMHFPEETEYKQRG